MVAPAPPSHPPPSANATGVWPTGGENGNSGTSQNLSPSSYLKQPGVPMVAGGAPVTEASTVLRINSTTWARDSHELFDYEARHVNKKCFYLKRQGRVFRVALDVSVLVEGAVLPEQADYLLSIRTREDRYVVVPAERHSPNLSPKKLWLIVRDLPEGTHHLTENDLIKLGRFKLKVRQLVKGGDSSELMELKLDDTEVPNSVVTPEEAAAMQCRICLLEGGGSEEDPLICPCQCRGSIKFVHVDCLRHWLNGRLGLVDNGLPRSSYFVRQLHCELCKTQFPSAVMVNSRRVPIVKVPQIPPPFIVLENVVGASNRGLHIISMAEKKDLKLGRGHESDVRIADVSISRYHATIRFNGGEFVLEDHNSKFGTLVSLRRFHAIEQDRALSVQVGRTVLNLSLEPTNSSLEFQDVLEVETGTNAADGSPVMSPSGGTFPATSAQTLAPGSNPPPAGTNGENNGGEGESGGGGEVQGSCNTSSSTSSSLSPVPEVWGSPTVLLNDVSWSKTLSGCVEYTDAAAATLSSSAQSSLAEVAARCIVLPYSSHSTAASLPSTFSSSSSSPCCSLPPSWSPQLPVTACVAASTPDSLSSPKPSLEQEEAEDMSTRHYCSSSTSSSGDVLGGGYEGEALFSKQRFCGGESLFKVQKSVVQSEATAESEDSPQQLPLLVSPLFSSGRNDGFDNGSDSDLSSVARTKSLFRSECIGGSWPTPAVFDESEAGSIGGRSLNSLDIESDAVISASRAAVFPSKLSTAIRHTRCCSMSSSSSTTTTVDDETEIEDECYDERCVCSSSSSTKTSWRALELLQEGEKSGLTQERLLDDLLASDTIQQER